MTTIHSAAFVLPDSADLRAVLFALADLDTSASVSASVCRPEPFTPCSTFWVIAEGDEPEEAHTAIRLVTELLTGTFGMTYTEV